jgi:hypothetical protein
LPPYQTADAILSADDERMAAICRMDAQALSELLTEDFTYAHGDGLREGREANLDRIRNRTVEYISVARLEASVRFVGKVGLLEGAGETRLRMRDGRVISFQNLFLGVWAYSQGRWRLAAYASTFTRPPA